VVEEGKPAPDFELVGDEGEKVRLSSLRGKPVVLYFYPRDDTPGCTAQACGIRDSYEVFGDRDVVVLGVSTDGESSHKRFKEKYELPFTLLADPDQTLGDVYGVAQEGKRSYARSTFVIDRDGKVAKIMHRVKPDTHAEQVLAAIPA
jgi:thioredoxin-dependent peroxiredoxin